MQKLVLILIAFIAMVTFIRTFDKAEAGMHDGGRNSITVSEPRAKK
ncbi:MAG: hypothetical protein LBD93_06205 [Treponema sp.]|jgi:hypothetical protein|nr:hypothetical protein [Treponema sp.]